ncbi:MAG: hypothetical protein K2J13_01910, partial [Clostridia bacterium]|nr:hypothetical protein [Clostridia bacterium]
GIARDCNYGLFVNINEGIIKNIKFEYYGEICAVNDGDVAINSVGIVCGINKGEIENCELKASGKFEYYYIEGESEDGNDYFRTYFGGFAGINSGSINKVVAHYEDFYLRIRTKARSDSMFGDGEISANTYAGGIAGNILYSGECTNIMITANSAVFNLTADSVGTKKGFTYSGAIAAYSFGKIDNIIVDFAPEYTEESQDSVGVSKNAVVYCGLATNVTAINYDASEANWRCNKCSCSNHIGYCNYVETDENTNVRIYINDVGNQVIKIKPIEDLIESVTFNKLKIDSNGNVIADRNRYENAPDDFDFQNFEDSWIYGKALEIQPYQISGESFWKIKATSGVKVEKDLTPPEIGVEFAFPNDGNY